MKRCELTDERLEELNARSIKDKIIEQMEGRTNWYWLGIDLGNKGYIMQTRLQPNSCENEHRKRGDIVFVFDNIPLTRESIDKGTEKLMREAEEAYNQAMELLKR